MVLVPLVLISLPSLVEGKDFVDHGLDVVGFDRGDHVLELRPAADEDACVSWDLALSLIEGFAWTKVPGMLGRKGVSGGGERDCLTSHRADVREGVKHARRLLVGLEAADEARRVLARLAMQTR